MFNKSYINYTTRPSSIKMDVREYKAPTDESVALYNEILEKAYTNILKQGTIPTNSLNIKYFIYRNNEKAETVCRYIFKLNDIIIDNEFEIDDFDYATSENLYKVILDKVCTVFTHKLVNDLAKEFISKGYA